MTDGVDFWQDAGVFLTHMDMLSNEDLSAIGTIVDEKIKSNNEAQTDLILSVVKKGFDGVDARFDAMESKFDAKLAVQKHELMDHTDRTVAKVVGDLRSELRERDLIG